MHFREILALSASLLGFFSFWSGLRTNGSHYTGGIGGSRDQPVLTGERVIDSEMNAFVRGVMDEWGMHGMSMVVVRPVLKKDTNEADLGGEVEYGTWGSGAEDGTSVAPETLFGIASCSKAFTAAALGILIDDFASGRNTTALPPSLPKLNWDSRLSDLLPGDRKLMDVYASEHATLEDLLSHVSGLPGTSLDYTDHDTVFNVIRRLRYLRPTLELRQGYQYNNPMYTTTSYIISHYTKLSFPEFVQSRIFDKLGMGQTTYSRENAEASGYFSQFWMANGRRIPFRSADEVVSAGPAGIISNAVDLSKWIKFMLNEGVIPGTNTRMLSKRSYGAITEATTIISGKGARGVSIVGYAKGWMRYSYQGIEVVCHLGGVYGLSAFVAFLPDTGFGLALITNTEGRPLTPIAHRVIEHAFGLNQLAEVPKASKWLEYEPRPRPNATLKLPISSYAGTYSNPGYGTFRLCHNGELPTDKYCESVISAFRTIDSVSALYPKASQNSASHGFKIPQLMASWPRLWSTHLRMYHHHDNTFTSSVNPPALFLEGFGKDQTPFQVTGPLGQELVIQFAEKSGGGDVGGFGVFGTLNDAERAGSHGGYMVRKTALAWFEKVL